LLDFEYDREGDVGKIDNGDFETFKEKTDQIYPIRAPKKQVIVTLMSDGGLIGPAMQIGELILKRGMTTFVPGDRTCASACALIWVAGWPPLRTVGDTPQIGFHAAYDEDTRRESGAGNAVVGAYLRDLGFGYKAIVFMTGKGPTSLEWLTPDLAKEKGVKWSKLQPPRAIPIPPQQPGLDPPLQITEAWSKLMPRPVTTSSGPDNETVVVKRASPYAPHARELVQPASPERSNKGDGPQPRRMVHAPDPPEEVRQMPQPVTTSPEPVRKQASKTTVRHGWIIQVGAFPAEQAAKQRLSTVESKASKMLTGAEAFTDAIEKNGTTYYRARFAGLDKDKAEAACEYLKKNDVECVSVFLTPSPKSAHPPEEVRDPARGPRSVTTESITPSAEPVALPGSFSFGVASIRSKRITLQNRSEGERHRAPGDWSRSP
jgi:hypothetical protein